MTAAANAAACDGAGPWPMAPAGRSSQEFDRAVRPPARQIAAALTVSPLRLRRRQMGIRDVAKRRPSRDAGLVTV